MKHSLITIITICLLLGCIKHGFKKPPVNRPSDDALIKLAEAADSISQSLLESAEVQKIITPPSLDNTVTIPNVYNFQTRASVDWSGPIEELTKRITKAAHYRFHVLGQRPPIPILVSLDVKDLSLGTILRNIDYQAGNKASIHVYPKRQIVELRYANLYH